MAYTVVDKGSKYFDTKLYTGNGSTQTITGLEFSPDFVWTKNRTNANSHQLYDSVRGVQKALFSNGTDIEETNANYLTAFNSDGFSVGSSAGLNGNGTNVASWNWRGSDSSAVSNTQGSITSTVSANTTSGFSIVSYTGTGANATVGHGLGVAPKMVIIKGRDTTYDWVVWFSGFSTTQRLLLNTTDAISTGGWNTLPTSSVFGLGTHLNINESTKTYIAYCFAEVKGFSKFGSYTGNGSTDGTFVYTGFKPAWLMMKRTDTLSQWRLWDNKRNTFNVADTVLLPNDSGADTTNSSQYVDLLSNGFKWRATYVDTNASGGTYIYAAFAENPFVSSKGIPCTAR